MQQMHAEGGTRTSTCFVNTTWSNAPCLRDIAGVALASTAARAMGSALAAPPSQLPVFYYGSAHPHGRRLADIRRGLGK